jgi:hypothetical protein
MSKYDLEIKGSPVSDFWNYKTSMPFSHQKIKTPLGGEYNFQASNTNTGQTIYRQLDVTTKNSIAGVTFANGSYVDFTIPPSILNGLIDDFVVHFTVTNTNATAIGVYSAPFFFDKYILLKSGATDATIQINKEVNWIENCLHQDFHTIRQKHRELGQDETNLNYSFSTATIAQNATRSFILPLHFSWSGTGICRNAIGNDLTLRIYLSREPNRTLSPADLSLTNMYLRIGYWEIPNTDYNDLISQSLSTGLDYRCFRRNVEVITSDFTANKVQTLQLKSTLGDVGALAILIKDPLGTPEHETYLPISNIDLQNQSNASLLNNIAYTGAELKSLNIKLLKNQFPFFENIYFLIFSPDFCYNLKTNTHSGAIKLQNTNKLLLTLPANATQVEVIVISYVFGFIRIRNGNFSEFSS